MIRRIAGFSVLVLLCGSLAGVAPRAQSTLPLKGSWVVMVTSVAGTIPMGFSFKQNGRGTIDVPGGSLTLVYRENGMNFSTTVEVPAEASFTGQGYTMILRGTKTTDSDMTGRVLFMTDTPDPSSSAGVLIGFGTFTGRRQ